MGGPQRLQAVASAAIVQEASGQLFLPSLSVDLLSVPSTQQQVVTLPKSPHR